MAFEDRIMKKHIKKSFIECPCWENTFGTSAHEYMCSLFLFPRLHVQSLSLPVRKFSFLSLLSEATTIFGSSKYIFHMAWTWIRMLSVSQNIKKHTQTKGQRLIYIYIFNMYKIFSFYNSLLTRTLKQG